MQTVTAKNMPRLLQTCAVVVLFLLFWPVLALASAPAATESTHRQVWLTDLHGAVEYFLATGSSSQSLRDSPAVNGDTNRVLVLTAVSWPYRQLAERWLLNMERSGPELPYLVLALDAASLRWLGHWQQSPLTGDSISNSTISRTPRAVNASFTVTNRLEKFVIRHIAIAELLQRNVSVVWTDVDCLWLRTDLYSTWLRPYSHSLDIVGQMGLWPQAISEKYGAALCTGFFAVFSNQRSIALFRLVTALIRGGALNNKDSLQDDQLVVNIALQKLRAFDGLRKTIAPAHSHVSSTNLGMHKPQSTTGRKRFVTNNTSVISVGSVNYTAYTLTASKQLFIPTISHSSCEDGEFRCAIVTDAPVYGHKNNLKQLSHQFSIVTSRLNAFEGNCSYFRFTDHCCQRRENLDVQANLAHTETINSYKTTRVRLGFLPYQAFPRGDFSDFDEWNKIVKHFEQHCRDRDRNEGLCSAEAPWIWHQLSSTKSVNRNSVAEKIKKQTIDGVAQ